MVGRGHLVAVPSPEWFSVLAVDPGQWTGWAWLGFCSLDLLDHTDHSLILASAGLVEPLFLSGQLDCSDEDLGVDALVRYAQAGFSRTEAVAHRKTTAPNVSSVVVCEDFLLRERTMDRSLLSPVRLNAKLGYAFHGSETTFTDRQSSSDAKTSITDDRLKRWGLYQRGATHRNDAVRHLILWLRKLRSS